MPDLGINLLLQVLATAWGGLGIGVILGDWDQALVAVGIALALLVVSTLTAWRPPADEVAGHWEDLGWRERRAVYRALLTGSDPGSERLARVTAKAREASPRAAGPLASS